MPSARTTARGATLFASVEHFTAPNQQEAHAAAWAVEEIPARRRGPVWMHTAARSHSRHRLQHEIFYRLNSRKHMQVGVLQSIRMTAIAISFTVEEDETSVRGGIPPEYVRIILQRVCRTVHLPRSHREI